MIAYICFGKPTLTNEAVASAHATDFHPDEAVDSYSSTLILSMTHVEDGIFSYDILHTRAWDPEDASRAF
jgi:hypothetical protein